MKYFTILAFSFFMLLFGSISYYGNFLPAKICGATNAFVSKHNASKIQFENNLTIIIEESDLEVEEEFNYNNDLKSSLNKSTSFLNNNLSIIDAAFVAIFDLNIFNNYFNNPPQIIINHNPLYIIQSVFLI